VERHFQAKTLAELAFHQLRDDILRAKLRPEERLHIERLSKIYGVGATPLREALSRLSSMGLVTAVGQRGFRVAPVSIGDLLDITRTRAWVEATALRASIEEGDRDWEAEIIAAAHRLRGFAPTDVGGLSDDWNRANRAFHDALVSRCNSPQLLAFRDLLYDQSDRYRRLSVRDGLAGRRLAAEHDSIMKAVLARDADVAIERVTENFLETTRKILSAYVGRKSEVPAIIDQLRAEIRAGAGVSARGRSTRK
jgi:DNA-binding GntR family transcriptional regulator